MSKSQVFKNQTVVVQFVCALLAGIGCLTMSLEVRAQDYITVPNPNVASSAQQSCTLVMSKISTAMTNVGRACNGDENCIQKELHCASSSTSLGDQAMSGSSISDVCRAINNSDCAEFNQSYESAAADKKDAGKSRKEAAEAKDKAAEEFQKAQTDAQQKQQEAAKQMVKLRKEYRDQRKQMMDENEKKLSEGKQKKLEAVKQAQEQLDAIDKEYIELRDKLRQQADAVSDGEYRWKVDCRASALNDSKKVQAELDKQMAQEQAMVNQINNSSANLFGLRYRRLNKKRKKIADVYNENLTRCLKGELDPGRNFMNEINKARLVLASLQKSSDEKDVVLKQRQLAVKTQLENLQKDADEKVRKAAERLQRDLADADSDFQQNMQLLQQQQAAAQQNAQQSQQANLRKLEQADRELQSASRDQALASNRALCAEQSGGRGSTNSDRPISQSAARRSVVEGASYCGGLSRCDISEYSSSGGQASEIQGYQQQCKILARAAAGINSSNGSNGGARANQ